MPPTDLRDAPQRSEDGANFVDSFSRLNVTDSSSGGGTENRVGPEGEPVPRTEDEYGQTQLTLRAIVTSKEAGVVIGKGGKNVAELRDETGVKAGVSKVIQGVADRVLTVTGPVDGVAKAYSIVARGLLEGAPAVGMGGVVNNNGTHPIRLLISHNQMGTIIGRQGLKIKHIQDVSGVRMVAQKDMLPQSTERIVEVQGTPEGVQKAVWEICKCLVDDWQRGTGTVLYNPTVRQGGGGGGDRGDRGMGELSNGMRGSGMGGGGRSYPRTGNGADFSDHAPTGGYGRRGPSEPSGRGMGMTSEDGEEMQTQNISIPADMVGCIIGRGGSKISDIRKSSGSRISIAKAPHDETGERMFTIVGSVSNNEKALYLLYENLEAEKMRRSQGAMQE
ncbi:MAG: hypothetical protein M1823_003174 [Watsoniomyces obsoletus]|nr:MAG: hypothetical protein M1823_003174 [Watsoniomyces obsoletus]